MRAMAKLCGNAPDAEGKRSHSLRSAEKREIGVKTAGDVVDEGAQDAVRRQFDSSCDGGREAYQSRLDGDFRADRWPYSNNNSARLRSKLMATRT